MLTAFEIRDLVLSKGADLFGIASVSRFNDAPEGFHPTDVYAKAQSVIVFAVQLPSESLYAANPIPFTHMNTLAMRRVDDLTFNLSLDLDKAGVKNVLIPTDDPYLFWDADKQEGRAILSMRHLGLMAGLGYLGRNNLLINKQYGSMIQIGALLTPYVFTESPIVEASCPPNCRICLDACPQHALTGKTVIQKACRPISNFLTEKGYSIKKCYECRKKCPRVLGY